MRKSSIVLSAAAAAATCARLAVRRKRKKALKPLNKGVTYELLAMALASDYESVYYIKMKDSSYIEFGPEKDSRQLRIISQGDDFFADTIVNCHRLVYKDDQERFLKTFSRENMLEALRRGETFTLDYRLVIDGVPRYYNLKTAACNCRSYVVIGVRNVDEQTRRELAENEKNRTYGQIAAALASRYEVIYYVNVNTDEFTEYAASEKYSQLEIGNKGSDFFKLSQENMQRDIYPEDLPMMRREMEKERFLSELAKDESYSLTYRLMLDGNPEYVNLRAVRPDDDPDHVIIAVTNIDSSKRREQEFNEALGSVMTMATKDVLTGVKNKLAYTQSTAELDGSIKRGEQPEFGIVVCDVNGLKNVNDTAGHQAGDEYLRAACSIICHVFKHSPVFRVGGDEFAVLLSGEDYTDREELLKTLKAVMLANKVSGDVTAASGMAVFNPRDRSVEAVFNRVDAAMYRNKKTFK